MTDENVIIEDNEQNVGEYDPNPYDNVTVEEALKQLFNRFTPRTVRQAIFTMAENNKPATLIEKSITDNGEYTASTDNADGYSKVTVNVPSSSGSTLKVVPIPNMNLTGTSGSIYSPVSAGIFDIMLGYNDAEAYGNAAYLSQPASKITITTYDAGSGTIYFTPAETFDGFYHGDNEMSLYGDTITPGDGYAYKAVVDRTSEYPNRVTITKYSTGPQVIPNA